MLLDAISIVVSIFLMIAIGYLLAYKGIFAKGAEDVLSALVVKAGLPGMIVHNVLTSFTRDTLLSSIGLMLIPGISMGVLYVLAMGLARLIRVPPNRRGVFCAMITFSNTVFIGVPVSLALFGEEALSTTLISYIANTLIFWTVGITGLRRDSGKKSTGLFSKGNLKQLFSLPLVTFFLCVLLVVFGLQLPAFVATAADYLGRLVTPCSLLFTGILLFRMGLSNIRIDRYLVCMLAGRFILAPGLVFVLCRLLNVEGFVTSVLVVQAGMPVMSQTAILARAEGADAEYTTVGTALSLLLSFVFIPLYRVLLGG